MARLKEKYNAEVAPALMKQFSRASPQPTFTTTLSILGICMTLL